MSILKDLIQEIKIQATNWEKIFAKFIFDTGVGHKIDRDLLNNPVNNKQRSEQTTQPKKLYREYKTETHSTSYTIRELQIKVTSYHTTHIRLLNSNYMTIPIAGG